MFRAAPVLERRRHPRAQLNLPVRLRWLGPFRTVIEIAQTMDVARDGFLFYRPEECPVNVRAWVTLPFDSRDPSTQPEIPGRIARVRSTPAGRHLVAVRFERSQPDNKAFFFQERRACPRVPLSVLVRVRADSRPWPEEIMTLDVANGGARLETARLYSPGEVLHVRLPYGKWVYTGETTAEVERVEAIPGAVEQRVALSWTPLPGGPRPRMSRDAKTALQTQGP